GAVGEGACADPQQHPAEGAGAPVSGAAEADGPGQGEGGGPLEAGDRQGHVQARTGGGALRRRGAEEAGQNAARRRGRCQLGRGGRRTGRGRRTASRSAGRVGSPRRDRGNTPCSSTPTTGPGSSSINSWSSTLGVGAASIRSRWS